MLKTSENILIESLAEALETMAFMIAMPPEEELPAPAQSTLAWMDFQGPVCGRAELLAGGEMMQMAAANIMGLEPDDSQIVEKSIDAFKELLNTTCGVLLPRLANSAQDVFDVTVPQSQNFTSVEQWREYVQQENVTVLDVDGYPVAVRLTFKK